MSPAGDRDSAPTHAAGTTRSRVANALAISVAALLLLLPAFLNHGPLLNPDCAAYFRHGRAVFRALAHPVAQRPPLAVRSEFYDLASFLLGFAHSFWPITIAGALAASWFLWLTLRSTLKLSTLRSLTIVCALAALTPLPWFASLAMPDIFSGVVVLGLFLIAFADLTRGERLAAAALTAWAITTHPTYLPVALVLCVSMAALPLGRQNLRSVAHAALVLLIAALAQILIHTYLYRSPTLSGQTAPFLAARLVADGPAQQTLAELCPTTHWELCNDLSHLPRNDTEFLWTPGSIWQTATPTQQRLILDQQLPLARATLRLHGRQQLRISAQNVWTVLANPSLDEFAPFPGTAAWLEPVLPGSGARYLHSPQGRGAFPLNPLSTLIRIVADICWLALIPLLWLAHRRRAHRTLALAAVTVAALLANAVLCGVVSGVYSRYESRLIWLLPLLTVALTATALRPTNE